ncbi:hypothetical protein NQ314_008932 [Rhamnusium bicolor]|uniref:Uncharacterized protein n=1 Tax=Rhamnusium bicolor TaxID=1586634 RepID=A0AAV8Y434_9CUCU|nr:hypothetical protein NQ314_008932 [Rhamnusium bicolor]
MDELDPTEEFDEKRPSVKELVARIQLQAVSNNGNNSESSDDDDGSLRIIQKRGTMENFNIESLPLSVSNYENVSNDALPGCRTSVYSPTIVNTALVDSNVRYVDPMIKIQHSNIKYDTYNQSSTSKHDLRFRPEMRYIEPSYKNQYYENDAPNRNKYYEHNLNMRLAKLRVLDNSKVYDGKTALEGTSRMLNTNYERIHAQESADKDTNNDSGYSTKVYGSSKVLLSMKDNAYKWQASSKD